MLYRALQNHQYHSETSAAQPEMLSGSITSMRFYFIVPYVAKKKNIYVPSSQTHGTVTLREIQKIFVMVQL